MTGYRPLRQRGYGKTAPAALMLALVGPLIAGAVPTLASEPLYVKNLSPITGLIGLPSQRNAITVPAGALELAVHSSIASHFVNDASAREFVNLDGETLRMALDLRVGLAENWDMHVEVPWIDHSGGHLDKPIDNWHDFWGMADGGREAVPRDLLDYRYASADGSYGLLESSSGVGDVSLSVSHAFYRDEDAAATVVVGYKFGSGDEEEFTGSGADDVFLALRMSGDHLSDLPLSWHGQVGYLHAGDSDLLGDTQETELWFAGLSVDWRVAQQWSLLAQVDAHAAPLDSSLTATGDDAFLLSFGGRWYVSPRWQVDVSIVEDIQVETAPDVTFQASVRFVPGKDG